MNDSLQLLQLLHSEWGVVKDNLMAALSLVMYIRCVNIVRDPKNYLNAIDVLLHQRILTPDNFTPENL